MRFSASSRYLRAVAGQPHALLEDLAATPRAAGSPPRACSTICSSRARQSSNLMSVISLLDVASPGRRGALVQQDLDRVAGARLRRAAHDRARRTAGSNCSLARAPPAARGDRAARPRRRTGGADALHAVPRRRGEPAAQLREQRRAVGNPSDRVAESARRFWPAPPDARQPAGDVAPRAAQPARVSSSSRRCRSRRGRGLGEHAAAGERVHPLALALETVGHRLLEALVEVGTARGPPPASPAPPARRPPTAWARAGRPRSPRW